MFFVCFSFREIVKGSFEDNEGVFVKHCVRLAALAGQPHDNTLLESTVVSPRCGFARS